MSVRSPCRRHALNLLGESGSDQYQKAAGQGLAGLKNVRFSELVRLVEAFGFRQARTEGSHHIFVHPGIPELVNLQDVGGRAKPYQVRQFLKLVEKHNLKMEV